MTQREFNHILRSLKGLSPEQLERAAPRIRHRAESQRDPHSAGQRNRLRRYELRRPHRMHQGGSAYAYRPEHEPEAYGRLRP